MRFGLPTAPVSLDPRYSTDAVSGRICRLIYQSLVDFDAEFQPIPSLATWQMIDPRRFRFTLIRGPRFDDGVPVTAMDVVATYRAVLDPKTASPHRGALAHVASVTALDQRTIEFELSRDDRLFPGLLVIGVMRAADAAAPHSPTVPIGSGPFRVIAPPTLQRISIARLSDGQRIDFVVVPNETTRALKLARGELDVVQGGLTPELVHWLRRRPSLRVKQHPGTVFSYLGFNFARGPTQDSSVRR
ncbi:MAG: ABC transporter substrate-binding protein, partial [Gammaproteobacteria bacterium]